MPELTEEQAKQIIEEIRENNGGISQEDRAKTPPKVLIALDNVRRKLGAATTTLASNLYSKDTRFIFELIQNAEDNEYTKAAAAGQKPYIEFSIYSDRIIIDSNEDGFSENNVKAICSIGESTKTVTAGYIGEKGIGFKSVFKIASKVHIQSGPFSFFFAHNRDDGGLGMVTPHYQEHEELPDHVHTRITMMLADPGHTSVTAADFDEIPDTLVVFLKKLKRITIDKYQNKYGSATKQNNKCTYSYDEPDGQGTISKSLTSDDMTRESTSNFRVVRKLLDDLPKVEARKHTRKAEVVLAFPVDDGSNPVFEQQHVFAFLPLCRAGFKFLIQSDFLTQASREDVMESPWNDRILRGVAETFTSAIRKFCDQPTLQYKWLGYLPEKSIPGTFWSQLRPMIIRILSDTRILHSKDGSSLKAPRKLRFVPSKYSDRYGEPLVEDLARRLYISPRYLNVVRYHDDLKELGVKALAWWEFFERFRADVERPDSKLKARGTEEDWHSRVSDILIEGYSLDTTCQLSLRSLAFIPLDDGRWVSPKKGDIYFPDYSKIAIPTDLGLRLLNRRALDSASRVSLLAKLGVNVCTRDTVVSRVRENYDKHTKPNLTSSVSHQRFFYYIQEEYDADIDEEMFLFDSDGERVYRYLEDVGRTDLYFESKEEYAIQQLMAMSMVRPSNAGSSTSRPSVHFIHPEYVKAVGSDERQGGRSWELWLENVQQVRREPRLINPDDENELSEIFLFVAEKCKEKLLGTLKTYWHAYEGLIEPDIAEKIGELKVPCKNGQDRRIMDAYLPELKLTMKCNELGLSSQWPFLDTPWFSFADWSFLKKFGTKSQLNLQFYLDAIQIFRTGDKVLARENDSKIFDVYEDIEDKSTAADHKAIHDLFWDKDLVYVRSTDSESPWEELEFCVWEGEDFLKSNTPLAHLSGYSDRKRLKRLFQDILKLSNAGSCEYLEEIEFRMKENSDLDDLPRIYQRLSEVTTAEELPELRSTFEVQRLIYSFSTKEWCASKSCLWAESTSIVNKLAIAAEYPGLEDFFVSDLQVEKPNVEMYIRELQRLEKNRGTASIDKVKELMKEINLREPQPEQLRPLLSLHILPVKSRSGSIKLKTAADDFAIVDRVEYGDAFKGKLRTLEFTLEEVHTMRHFLKAMMLEGRHMSRAVKEDTTVREGSEDKTLSSEFRQRARAIYRCAVHFDSPRCVTDDSSLYATLCKTEIFKSDGITKSLTIRQGRKPITVEGSTGTLHIKEENGSLRIYVPRDSREQRRCYLLKLPRKLLSHMDIESEKALTVMQLVLQGSAEFLNDVLEDSGIIEVPELESFDDRNHSESDNAEILEVASATSNLTVDYRRPTAGRYFATPETPRTFPTESGDSHSHTDALRSSPRAEYTPPASFPPTPDRFGRDVLEPQTLGSNNDYRSLLDRIIKAAETTRFPSVGAFAFDAMTNALPSEAEAETPFVMLGNSVFGMRSENQMKHDMKIGAAGELFVFEILQRLPLTGFGHGNWKSTIRKEVRVHEKYADMPPWDGAETADITYSDTKGDLTNYLIDKGYLIGCQGMRPKYYLEVKTTTKGCRTPFYMSKQQFARMQAMHDANVSSASEAKKEMYVVIRVYNLGQENMALRLYVDPEALRREEQLIFTAESYTVAPA